MHVHSSGWSTTYTRLHVATMLCADTDCCTRTYVYTLPQLRTSQRVNYTTVPFISKVYDRNPKSTISSGSSTGAQKPRKLSIPAPIAAKLYTGQSARLLGRAALHTNFLHHSECEHKISSCGTGTGRTHGDFAWHVAIRPCTCAAPDCHLNYVFTATCSCKAIRTVVQQG